MTLGVASIGFPQSPVPGDARQRWRGSGKGKTQCLPSRLERSRKEINKAGAMDTDTDVPKANEVMPLLCLKSFISSHPQEHDDSLLPSARQAQLLLLHLSVFLLSFISVPLSLCAIARHMTGIFVSSLRPPDLSYSAPSRLILVALVFKLLLLSSPQCMRLCNTLYTYYGSYYPKLKSFTNLSLQRLKPLLHPECSLSTGDTLGSQS